MAKLFALFLSLFTAVFVSAPVVQTVVPEPTPEVAGVSVTEEPAPVLPVALAVESDVTLPITVTKFNPWYKEFGTWVDDGRFYGFHAGDDIEMDLADLQARGIKDIPVFAMADGTVQYVAWTNGYGGVIILKHELDGQTISTLYGHVDLDNGAAMVKKGEVVKKGQQIAVLGEGLTHETDRRRTHLHFAMWKGEEVKFPGYVATKEELAGWMDPYQFFVERSVVPVTPPEIPHIKQEGG